MKRLVEHHSELSSHEKKVSEAALNTIQPLQSGGFDGEPTFDELRKAIDDLAPGRAP